MWSEDRGGSYMLFDRKARVGYDVCRKFVLSRIHVAVFYVSLLLLSHGNLTRTQG
jgi:hypothetical protein